VVFTGEWRAYFGPAQEKAASADLSMQWKDQDSKWPHAKLCRVRGKACLHGNHIIQSRLALFRMSKRFASEWLGLRAHRQLQGHDEALVAAVCDASAQCRRKQMHFPGGVYVMGHYGLFLAKSSSPVYKLRILASFQGGKVDESKFPTDADVPRERIYHPVKCEAEYQSEDRGREGV
jgi:hypothetical protein